MTTVSNIKLAYNCSIPRAVEIHDQQTQFARAARYFGPMFAHYDENLRRWLLFGKVNRINDIIDAAQQRVCEANPGCVLIIEGQA